MSEKHYPDRNRKTESEVDRDHKPDPDQHHVDDDLRLWGPESEEETIHYGDLRDQGFQAGSTSQPGSMNEETHKKHGWQAEDAPLEEEDTKPGADTRKRHEKELQRPDNDRSD
jgi:hypothetical protein